MSLPVTSRIAGPYSCNGALVTFSFAFKVFEAANIQVIHTTAAAAETTLALTTNYTVALNADQEANPGGTITTVSTYATGQKITILGALAYGQPTVLTNLGAFFPKVIEAAMDRLGILIQQIKEQLDRAVRMPASSGASGELPAPAAGLVLGWNAAANGLVNLASPGALTVSPFVMTVLDDTTAAAVLATLGALAADGTGTLTGPLVFEGATADAFETTLTVTDPTADRTITLPDETCELGFRNIPQNSKSAAYTAVLADSGKHILHPSADTTARIFTIDANATVAYPIGTAITFVNQASAGVVTIAITTDTMRLAGAGTVGSRTLAANGIATALKLTATEWIISGTGLT